MAALFLSDHRQREAATHHHRTSAISTPSKPCDRVRAVSYTHLDVYKRQGYTGLAAALELAEAGYKVVVLEAERIGWGASGRNGGQAIAGFGCGEAKLEALVGFDDARKMFDLSREGLQWLRGRIRKHGIECDWRDGHATVPIKPRQQREVMAAVEDFNTRYGYPVEWWDREKLRTQLASDRYLGCLLYTSRCV